MSEPTRIERRSLEAHVELCAKRYSYLESQIDTINTKLSKVDNVVEQVYQLVANNEKQRDDRLINWGVGVIGLLVGVIGWLLSTYVFK